MGREEILIEKKRNPGHLLIKVFLAGAERKWA